MTLVKYILVSHYSWGGGKQNFTTVASTGGSRITGGGTRGRVGGGAKIKSAHATF